MKPWLKAGLIGAAVLVVLNLLGAVPCVGAVTCILGIVAYGAIGALAAFYMPPTRQAGPAAGQGALAALLAAFAGGIVNAIVFSIQATAMGSARVLSQIPPELIDQWQQAGLDMALLDQLVGPRGALLSGGLCCGGGLVVAAVLGALGGAILAGVKPE